jgi:hypothetical protein
MACGMTPDWLLINCFAFWFTVMVTLGVTIVLGLTP